MKQNCEFGEVTGECNNRNRVALGIHEVCDSNGQRLSVCSDHLLFEYIEDESKEEGKDYELVNIDQKALDRFIANERKKGIFRG